MHAIHYVEIGLNLIRQNEAFQFRLFKINLKAREDETVAVKHL